MTDGGGVYMALVAMEEEEEGVLDVGLQLCAPPFM